MISKSSQYALRGVIYIASRHAEEQKLGIKEIAKAVEAPAAFTAKVLQSLTRKGVISAVRGPGGGFFMDQHQLGQPLLNIVQAIDGPKVFTGCGLGLKYCSDKNPCPIHDAYQEVRFRMLKLLQNTSIKTLATKHNKGMPLVDINKRK